MDHVEHTKYKDCHDYCTLVQIFATMKVQFEPPMFLLSTWPVS